MQNFLNNTVHWILIQLPNYNAIKGQPCFGDQCTKMLQVGIIILCETKLIYKGMLQHSLGGAVIFVSLQQIIAPALALVSTYKLISPCGELSTYWLESFSMEQIRAHLYQFENLPKVKVYWGICLHRSQMSYGSHLHNGPSNINT